MPATTKVVKNDTSSNLLLVLTNVNINNSIMQLSNITFNSIVSLITELPIIKPNIDVMHSTTKNILLNIFFSSNNK